MSVFISEQPHSSDVYVEWGVEAVDAVLVAAWCAISWKDLRPFLRAPAGASWYLIAALGSVATFAAAFAVMYFCERILGVEPLRLAEPVFNAGFGWPALVFTLCVQPAIVEELAFRGVILGGLSRFLRPGEAVVVSSLMFMVFHDAPLTFPHLFLLGLALALLRLRSGSIYPGMVLHFLHNLYSVIEEVYFRP